MKILHQKSAISVVQCESCIVKRIIRRNFKGFEGTCKCRLSCRRKAGVGRELQILEGTVPIGEK